MKIHYLLSLIVLVLLASKSIAQPINDDCSNAIVLTPSVTPNCSFTSGTFSGAVLGGISCETGNHQDIWYQFVATEETNNIVVSAATGANEGFEIIDGGCGGTSIACINSNSTSSESYISDQFVVGNAYYIRVYNAFTNASTSVTSICIESFPPPANDDCANAEVIIPSLTPNCSYTNGTFSGAALGTISCETGSHQDIWYQFVATEETNRIVVGAATGANEGFEIIDGGCGGTSIACINSNSTSSESYTSDQFIVGNTYFIRVYNAFTNVSTSVTSICIESFPPPANDDCANAEVIIPSITPNCTYTNGTFSGAALGTISCETGSHQDIWYQFVATEKINRIVVGAATGANEGFEIIDGGCAGTSIACINSNSTSSESYTSDQFIVGNVYYVRVYNAFTNLSSAITSICIESFPPPANDDCNNAVAITPSISPACNTVLGTFSGASLNTITCETGDHQDVWYSFVATEEINRIQLSSSSGLDHGFEVIDANCSGTSLFCVDNNGFSFSEGFTTDQYTIGNTYFVRVFNSFTNLASQDFTICIESFPPPANDDCTNATAITPSITPACNTLPVTFSGASLNSITCETGDHQDVWYQFTATSVMNRIYLSPEAGLDHGFEVIEGNCNGVSMFCMDNNGTSLSESSVSSIFTIGTTYFIRVYNTGTYLSSGNFGICVESFPVSVNDDCSDAISITPSVSPACNTVSGSFSAATLGTIPCEAGNHQDVWFQFVATEAVTKISLSAETNVDHGLEVIDGSCSGTSITCVNDNGVNFSEQYISDQFIPGNTYFVRVFNAFTTQSTLDFDICVESFPPPSNDDCSAATSITPSVSPACNAVPGTFSGVGLNTIPCETGDHQDVWFSFVATAELNRISLSATSSLDHGFEVVDGSCSGPGLFCLDNNGSNFGEENTSNQYVVGNTYYIRVYNSDTNVSSLEFDICVESFPAPSNNDCANATSLSAGTSCSYTTGSFSGASETFVSCESGDHQDVWYQFVATNDTMYIELDATNDLDHGFEVLDACNGTSLSCTNDNGMSFSESREETNLTIGDTYFVRVYNANSGLSLQTFDICIYGEDQNAGISDIEGEMELRIYPNPSNTGIFNMKTVDQISELEVYDVSQKLVFRKSSSNNIETINLSRFAKGVYYVKCTSIGGGRAIQKVVKN